MSNNGSNLIEMAKQEFDNLTEVEERFFQAVSNGRVANFSVKDTNSNDPAGANKWGPERTIKADRIAWLCRDGHASKLVTHNGIWLKGARIDGKIELNGAHISFPFFFDRSALPEGISLLSAELFSLCLPGSHTGAIIADGLKVHTGVFLQNGFRAKGEVRLLGSTIGKELSCINGHFINSDGHSLNAEGLTVDGSVFLCNGFSSKGEVNLAGASIRGNLECNKGNFINPEGYALAADRLKVNGSVFLCEIKTEGEVCLIGATIGSTVDCQKGKFINPNGYSLMAERMKSEGNVYLRNGFISEGEVSLNGTYINGNLYCGNAKFSNNKAIALSANGLKVEDNVLISDDSRITGEVSLVSARINGFFYWTGLASPEETKLDLRSARIGTLRDEQKSWPEIGRLFLHGLVYDEIHNRSPRDADSRIDWLQRQYNTEAEEDKNQFWPQPYEQLADVLRKGGDDEGAKKILIAKNIAKARLTKLTWGERLRHFAFGTLIGYGYRPWRVVWFGLMIVLLGWLFFWAGHRAKVMTSTKEGTYPSVGFSAIVYSLDVFVPLIDLRQASSWMPDANRTGKVQISDKLNIPLSGKALRYYFWFEISAGWVLTTLLLAGVTGLVRT